MGLFRRGPTEESRLLFYQANRVVEVFGRERPYAG